MAEATNFTPSSTEAASFTVTVAGTELALNSVSLAATAFTVKATLAEPVAPEESAIA